LHIIAAAEVSYEAPGQREIAANDPTVAGMFNPCCVFADIRFNHCLCG
jgi:hypothetical protein